jgi:hypothetical protein
MFPPHYTTMYGPDKQVNGCSNEIGLEPAKAAQAKSRRPELAASVLSADPGRG